LDYGIRSILAPSFADIFYNNCFQNGILPVVLTPQEIQTLFDRTDSQDIYQVTVDLPQQFVLLPEGERYAFTVDPFRKDCMIKGLDGIGLTLQHEAAISDYEARRVKAAPWLFQDQRT
jgi:3-isopropylmalate/(R)-2-methylmalate dehydratase small subunit